VLGIHAALRNFFETKEQSFAWMQKHNAHPFFQGRTPVSLMTSGKLEDICMTKATIDSMFT
jgi:hypothetical protein